MNDTGATGLELHQKKNVIATSEREEGQGQFYP